MSQSEDGSLMRDIGIVECIFNYLNAKDTFQVIACIQCLYDISKIHKGQLAISQMDNEKRMMLRPISVAIKQNAPIFELQIASNNHKNDNKNNNDSNNNNNNDTHNEQKTDEMIPCDKHWIYKNKNNEQNICDFNDYISSLCVYLIENQLNETSDTILKGCKKLCMVNPNFASSIFPYIITDILHQSSF